MTDDAIFWTDCLADVNLSFLPRIGYLETEYGLGYDADGIWIDRGLLHARPNRIRCFFALLIAEAVK